MDPLEILRREHTILKEHISQLEEMTYSVSVNVRDLSNLFKDLSLLWEQHEEKMELLFKILLREGISRPIESISFKHGELEVYGKSVQKAIESGEDETIKEVLQGVCGDLIDLVKSHLIAEENLLEIVPWGKLSKKTLEKIELLQIIPSDEWLE